MPSLRGRHPQHADRQAPNAELLQPEVPPEATSAQHQADNINNMLKVGDLVQDMHPIEFEDDEPVPTGVIWFVTQVNPRDDGKTVVTLERYDHDRQMITSTVVCTPYTNEYNNKDAA